MRLRPAVIAGAAALALTLSGCAEEPPSPYASATASDLQQSVLHVTEAAGDGDYAAARTRLDELEVATKVAHARGEITAARQDSILAAIALVRADLESLIAKAEAAAAEKKAEEEAARKAAEAEAAEEARLAAEAEAQAEAERRAAEEAAQREAGGNEGDGGNGKGKDKGSKGQGKGKGKGK